LEGGGTISHSEEHHERFKEATVGAESHFLFISGLDVYIIEIPADVKFCEVSSSAELGDKFGDEGEGIFVLNGYGVQCMIALDQPEQTIFLLNKEYRGCYEELERSDSSYTEVFL